MKTTLCTLYNSLYLDKGLVLYDSLKTCAKDFELYVLCMDDKTFEVLSDINEERLKPIRLSDVENDKMLEAKSNRSVAEYCWTCSSRLIQYILETFRCECCTYIDADMYFYHDPQILVNEMLSAGKSVMMVPHRFPERNLAMAEKVGTYCVEFNCFKNDDAGREVLNHWHNKCLECCSNIGDGIHWGDQKYMDEWLSLFPDKVHPCEHPGAGIAPWNVELYSDYDDKDDSVVFVRNHQRVDIVFYHYQSVSYITTKIISTGIDLNIGADDQLINRLYKDYLMAIDHKKTFLYDNYQLSLLVTSHPSNDLAWWKLILKSFTFIRKIKNALWKSDVYLIKIDE